MRIRDIATLPRRVQPVRHIISRKRRHREMQERAAQFRAMLENKIKRLDKKEAFDGRGTKDMGRTETRPGAG